MDNTTPKISPNFTVEDIHKIREWNYERRKDMTTEEIITDTQKGANELLEQIKKLKKNKNAATHNII